MLRVRRSPQETKDRRRRCCRNAFLEGVEEGIVGKELLVKLDELFKKHSIVQLNETLNLYDYADKERTREEFESASKRLLLLAHELHEECFIACQADA